MRTGFEWSKYLTSCVSEQPDCEHRTTEPRRKFKINGTFEVREQCLICGISIKTWKHSDFRNVNLLRNFDEELMDNYLQERSRRKGEEIEAKRLRYQEYLASEDWQNIRNRVLQRDNFVCQGCLCNQASEVHHLTYSHIGKEFGYELISLCSLCHKRIHGGLAEVTQ